MINDWQRTVIERVIEEGHCYSQYSVSEGSAESGPIPHEWHGIRWGQVFLELAQNGCMTLRWNTKRDPWHRFSVIPYNEPLYHVARQQIKVGCECLKIDQDRENDYRKLEEFTGCPVFLDWEFVKVMLERNGLSSPV
jgi:hypothetical protein